MGISTEEMENFTTNHHEQDQKTMLFQDECYKIYGCIYIFRMVR